jgi:hypothetical protein
MTMKRSALDLAAIADWETLSAAFHKAALGKAQRLEVRAFRANLDGELVALRDAILSGNPGCRPMRAFRIFDPKPRLIHAPAFRDRVLHHAVIAHVGPVIERSLIFDSYACRLGKGTVAAVRRCQHFARRFAWYGQIDIRAYFASVDHQILQRLLAKRFKDRALLSFLAAIVEGHATQAGKGLPIGALTSQHFANFYLDGADRVLLEGQRVRGLVRYMDDTVWWADSKDAVRQTLLAVSDFLCRERRLEVKLPAVTGQSRHGVSFCGFRILPGAILLSQRRRQRYAAARARWEQAFQEGTIDAHVLQAGYASALGMTAAADAQVWRQQQLQRVPLGAELADV